MDKTILNIAYKASIHNKDTLSNSQQCGCFHCLKVFSPSEIEEWCDESEDDVGVTAICPYCGVDSVLSEDSEYPLTDGFLSAMKERWF